MRTLCCGLVTLGLWGVASLPAAAQVIAGTSLFFDHGAEEQAYVQTYQLCVGTDCRDIGVTRVGTTVALTCTLPAWVPKGRQDLTVRAAWKAPLVGMSAPTNVLTQIVVGGPDRLRTTAVQP